MHFLILFDLYKLFLSHSDKIGMTLQNQDKTNNRLQYSVYTCKQTTCTAKVYILQCPPARYVCQHFVMFTHVNKYRLPRGIRRIHTICNIANSELPNDASIIRPDMLP